MFIAKELASSLNISSYMFVMIAMKERMIDDRDGSMDMKERNLYILSRLW